MKYFGTKPRDTRQVHLKIRFHCGGHKTKYSSEVNPHVSQSKNPSFKVECPECPVTRESDNFEALSDFGTKHNEHTGHEMEWVRAEFDHQIEPETNWELTCDTCEKSWRFETHTEAEEFQIEHAEVTDHEITDQPTEVEVDNTVETDLTAPSIKRFIEKMEDRYDEGVPEQMIYAQFSGDDPAVGEIKHEIHKLKDKGQVYEPRTGHLRAT